ncbi:MAG: hypothetical protein LBO04_02300 [Spirochaetaceae bacterium]|nr:hypothetical protein [Spirochaetaceae bacterium]
MIKDFVISVFGGAVAGWVTNSVAVSMLFRKFFGRWGGVIESGYRDLTQSLSRLVEQRLVNAGTLETEIRKPAFTAALRRCVKEILEKELPAKTENLRVKDMPGIDETLSRLAAYFERGGIAPSLPIDIKLGDILGEDAYRYIAEKNSEKIISGAAEYKGMAGETLASFFSGRAFGDVFSEAFIDRIKANINEAAGKMDFSDAGIDRGFEAFAEELGIDDIIKKIEEAAGEALIGELLGEPRKTARAFLNHIAAFLEIGPVRDLLTSALAEIIVEAESIDTKLCGILSPDLLENTRDFIRRVAPDLVDGLILFIIDSRDEIDNLIDEAAERHFKRGGRTNKPLQALLFEAVSKSTGFTNKIIETLSQNRIGAGEKLSAEFTAYIKNTSVGYLVSSLKESGLINAGIIASALPGKLRALRPENTEVFTSFMNLKVKTLFPNLDFSFIKTKLLPLIYRDLKQFPQNESGDERLRKKIDTAIASLAARKINDTIDFTKTFFNVNKTDVKNFLLGLWPELAGINAGSLFAGGPGILPWKRAAESVKTVNINVIYGILQNETLYGRAADSLVDLILRNLDTVLGGSVFEIAKNELDVLSPPQVNSMVHDFMGAQLKPINVIGAVLGGLAGFLTTLATVFFKLPPGFLISMFAVYGLVFALTGIGTNWVAVKMLFRPHKRIAGLNFPPFIGVTALRQAEFAAGIAKLIQQNMLNEAALRRFYAEKRDSLYARCKDRLSTENYRFIDDFLSDEARLKALVDGLVDILRDYIEASHTKLAEYIDKHITDRIESGAMESFAESLPEALVQKIKDGGAARIGKKIEERIADENLPDYQASGIINALLDIFYQYTRQNLRRLLNEKLPRRYEAAFTGYIENHTLGDLADKETVSGFTRRFVEGLGTLLQKAQVPAARLAARQKTNGKLPLKNCFGGALPAFIKRKGGLINRLLCGLVGDQKSVIVGRIMDGSAGASPFDRFVKQAANAVMRKDVEAITAIVIDEKFFPFLEAHRDAVFSIIDRALEHPLGFDSKVFNEAAAGAALSRLFASGRVVGETKNLSVAYLQNLSCTKLKNLLSVVNIETLTGLIARASPVTSIVTAEITRRLDDKATVKRLNGLINAAALKVFDGRPISRILRGTDLEAEAASITTMLFDDAAALETAKIITGNILQKICGDKDFYQHTLFRRDLSFFLRKCASETDHRILRDFLAGPFCGLLHNAADLVSPATRNAVSGDYVLQAMFSACENQFPDLVNSLSLYSVVEREVNMMTPAEIEGVFYSFAGPYFKKIILYGWIGLFVGLLSYALGCLPQLLP